MMHWDNGWHDGPGGWGWVAMAMMMIVFWGGIAWIIASYLRGGPTRTRPVASPGSVSAVGPEDILHERLARGEIEVDEYRQRLDAIRAAAHDNARDLR